MLQPGSAPPFVGTERVLHLCLESRIKGIVEFATYVV